MKFSIKMISKSKFLEEKMHFRSMLSIVLVSVVGPLVASGSAMAFSAKFSWRGIEACGSASPAFAISGAPKGTAALDFAMRDHNAPDFRHGGSTVPYSGKGNVAAGAISYIGPCPPGGQTHNYIWKIDALDASGSVLATTSASGSFPP